MVRKVDHVLKFPHRACEAVHVPHDNGTETTGADVGEHALILGPWCASGRADVVVDVPIRDHPASALGLPLAVCDLPADTERGSVVAGDPRVDRCSSRCHAPMIPL